MKVIICGYFYMLHTYINKILIKYTYKDIGNHIFSEGDII